MKHAKTSIKMVYLLGLEEGGREKKKKGCDFMAGSVGKIGQEMKFGRDY